MTVRNLRGIFSASAISSSLLGPFDGDLQGTARREWHSGFSAIAFGLYVLIGPAGVNLRTGSCPVTLAVGGKAGRQLI